MNTELLLIFTLINILAYWAWQYVLFQSIGSLTDKSFFDLSTPSKHPLDGRSTKLSNILLILFMLILSPP